MAKKESSFNVAQDLFSTAEEPREEIYQEKTKLIKKENTEINPVAAKETDKSSGSELEDGLEKTFKETKSKRFSLLAQPSLIDNLQAIAILKKVSLNELIVTEMKKVADENADLVEKYKSLF